MTNNNIYISFFLILFIWGCKESNKTNNEKPDKLIINQILSQSISEKLNLTKKFDSKTLQNLNLKELRLLRNEFFARKGYIFKTPDLNKAFSKYKWYKPKIKNSENILKKFNKIEKINIELIKQIENEKRNRISRIENINFSEYLRLIPQLELPLIFDCDKNELQSIELIRNDTILKFIPKGASVVGKLYENEDKLGIIYNFSADILIPFLYEYYSDGELISKYQLYELRNCLGDYESNEYQTYTNVRITKDLSINTEITEIKCEKQSDMIKCDTIRTISKININ